MKYLRNTHNANGEYRNLPEWKKIPNNLSGLIHHLSPNKPMDIYDIMADIYRYASQYPFENDIAFLGNHDNVKMVLELLVNFDMVKEL